MAFFPSREATRIDPFASNVVRVCMKLCATNGFRHLRGTGSKWRTLTSSAMKAALSTYPTVSSCPQPTCSCAPTPKLNIDYRGKLMNSIPHYDQHVVISTGRQDWRSRIEDEGSEDGSLCFEQANALKGHKLRDFIDAAGSQGSSPGLGPGQREIGLAKGLKKKLGPNGNWFDPLHTVLVTNSSMKPPDQVTPTASVFLFPAFQIITGIPDSSEGHESFIRNYLLRGSKSSSTSSKFSVSQLTKPMVLICSHGTRDERCGIIGPLLHAEFLTQLHNLGLDGLSEFVFMVSHLSGHKFAGNVIVYLPPGWRRPDSTGHQLLLENIGIWYGRVEPKHVEGLIHETILGGRVIEELCRGVVK